MMDERQEVMEDGLIESTVLQEADTASKNAEASIESEDASAQRVPTDEEAAEMSLSASENREGEVTEAQAAAIARAVSVAVDTALAEQVSVTVARAVSAAVEEAMAAAVTSALEQAVAETASRTRAQTVATATAEAEERLLRHIRACGQRPSENGVGSGGTGVRMHPSVRHLTRKDRAALANRAQRGETVLL